MNESHISLPHGNGGRLMRELIEEVFARHLANPGLDVRADAVALSLTGGEIYFTTDGFTVQPLEFPGGDIGSLAVHGTTNEPTRQRPWAWLAGDTKVLRRGEGGGLYLATTGVGVREHDLDLGVDRIRAGDAILVSGPVGDHGIAVMLAREQFGMHGELRSDVASVLPLTKALLRFSGLRFMRDPTRGGLASVMHEIAQANGCSLRLEREAIPVRPEVQSVCEMLGYDPFYLACEGRVVAVIAQDDADAALHAWQATTGGEAAAIGGEVGDGNGCKVVLATALGGERFLEELEEDPLPRIC